MSKTAELQINYIQLNSVSPLANCSSVVGNGHNLQVGMLLHMLSPAQLARFASLQTKA